MKNKDLRHKRIWIFLIVIATVFGLASIAVAVLSLVGINLFGSEISSIIEDVMFIVSTLVLSSVIIAVALYLRIGDGDNK